METAKKKNSQNPYRYLKVFLRIVLASVLACFGLWGAFLFYHRGVIVDTLPQSLVPTAEYLADHPTPDSLNIFPSIFTRKPVKICVEFTNERNPPLPWLIRFVLNGAPFPSDQIKTAQSYTITSCISPDLDVGLHLLEIQAPPLSPYQWAIYVEE